MADLINKVGRYQIVVNDMDERHNASSGTYTHGTLKPRYGPNRHRIVGAIYSHVDPYYLASVAHRYNMDYDDKEEVDALELVSKKPARSQSLRLARSLVKISVAAFTKPQFSSYTYDANKAHDVLDDFFRQKLIKHDFGQLPTPEQLKGKKYCKYHNMWNHNFADCVKLKDQIQVWINEGVVTLDEEKTVSLVDENPFPIVAMVDVVPAPRNKAKSKYEFYTYNADLTHVLLDELIQANLLNIPWGAYPSEEQLAGRLVIEEGYTKGPPEVSFHVAMVDVVWKNKSDRKTVEESDKGGDAGERLKEGKQETIHEASKILLCSGCKVECGIPISYNEFEIAVKAVEAKDRHSPPDHYQLASPTEPLKQAEVGFRFRESNLYKSNAKAGTSTFGSTQEVQKDILTKLYIPLASRNIIKDDTWYIKEKGKIVEISHTKIRNM
ncbi:hypothetical protein ACLB2K_051812 [Fragaria x ananassa]